MEQQQFRTVIITTVVASFVSAAIIGGVFGYAGAALFTMHAQSPSLLRSLLPQKTAGQMPVKEFTQPQFPTEEERVVQVVKRSSPSVVSVIVTKDVPIVERYYTSPFDNGPGGDLFEQFFGPQLQVPQYRQKGTEKREVGGGTGFIISSDGLILTNKHVVADTEADYTVLFNDSSKVPARVLARDPVEDVAVIKIEKTGLSALPVGDSGKLEIGQFVIAIGNALGEFQNTVSVGVVSGLNRSITASTNGGAEEQISGVIQTDAAINPGNSGGPLLNLRGEVIGMNTAIVLNAQNVGFAIPINKAKRDIESVKKTGKIVTPFLGVRYTLVTKEIAKANNLTVEYGALIIRGEKQTDLAVMPASPADKAGLAENDIILELNGTKIDGEHPLAILIGERTVGETIMLKVLHRGQEKEVRVVLEERR